MTYLELITNAYRLRNVLDANQVPDAEQGSVAVTLLNQMMAELKADSIELQYVPITTAGVSAPIGIPSYAEGGITAALAIRIVAGGTITPELQKQADDGMGTILRIATHAQLGAIRMDHIPAGEAVRRPGDFYTQ